MSLILEALKKAERQHKLGEVPGISSQVSERHGKGSGRLGWVMLTLFAVAMLGLGLYLGGMLTAPQPPQAARVEPAAEPAASAPPAVEPRPAGELTARPSRSLPGNTAPAPASSENVARPTPAETRQQPVQAEEKTVVAVEPPPEPRYEPPPEPAPPPALPLHEMPGGFVSNLPEMNIDIHSYDARPAKRYALINMEKYREGDYLAEGPLLIEILPDGVVMEHMGERFILPLGNL